MTDRISRKVKVAIRVSLGLIALYNRITHSLLLILLRGSATRPNTNYGDFGTVLTIT